MGLQFSACYLPPNSTFGVNANIFPPKEDIFWLISYLNSSLVTYFVRGIIIRSNMVTSGYISQVPIIPFDKHDKENLGYIARDTIEEKLSVHEAIKKIDSIIFNKIGLSANLVEKIIDFSKNLNRRV